MLLVTYKLLWSSSTSLASITMDWSHRLISVFLRHEIIEKNLCLSGLFMFLYKMAWCAFHFHGRPVYIKCLEMFQKVISPGLLLHLRTLHILKPLLPSKDWCSHNMSKVAGRLSSCVSMIGIAICFLYIPYLMERMKNISDTLTIKMDLFRVCYHWELVISFI